MFGFGDVCDMGDDGSNIHGLGVAKTLLHSGQIIYHIYLFSFVMKPIASMYSIFTYIYHKNQPNVGKYSIQYMDPMGREPYEPSLSTVN